MIAIATCICINVHAKSSLLICIYVFTYMQRNFIAIIIATAANRDTHIMLLKLLCGLYQLNNYNYNLIVNMTESAKTGFICTCYS